MAESVLLLAVPWPNKRGDAALGLGNQPTPFFRVKSAGLLNLRGIDLIVVIPLEGSLLLAALEATGQPGARQDALLVLGRETGGQDGEVGPADLEVPDDLDALVLWPVHGIAEGAVAGIPP